MIQTDENGLFYESPCQLPDYPLQVMEAKGTILSSNFIVCGGRQLFYSNDERIDISATDKCYLLDLATKSWKTMQSMIMKRRDFAMTSTNDNIFVCGGINLSGKGISSCEKFDGIWHSIQALPDPRNDHCMVSISGTSLLAIGGRNNSWTVRQGFPNFRKNMCLKIWLPFVIYLSLCFEF